MLWTTLSISSCGKTLQQRQRWWKWVAEEYCKIDVTMEPSRTVCQRELNTGTHWEKHYKLLDVMALHTQQRKTNVSPEIIKPSYTFSASREQLGTSNIILMPRTSSSFWFPDPSSQSCQKNFLVHKLWMLSTLDFLAPGFPSPFSCTSRSSTGRVSMEKAPGMVKPSPSHHFHPLGTGQGTSIATSTQNPQQSHPVGFPLIYQPNWASRVTGEGRKSALFLPLHPSFSPHPSLLPHPNQSKAAGVESQVKEQKNRGYGKSLS